MSEQRRSERHPCVVDATIICDSGTYRAELLDVNASGVGISWIEGNQAVADNTPARIECHHPSLNLQPLSGLTKGCSHNPTYRPNVRSFGLKIDDSCSASIEQMIQNCTCGRKAPAGSSKGLCQAWNILTPEEQMLVDDYFTKLGASESDVQRVARNLIMDQNSPAYRLQNFLDVLIKELLDKQNEEVAPSDILDRAFDIYEEQFSLPDTERDRSIKWI
jgi:hypothetical protein